MFVRAVILSVALFAVLFVLYVALDSYLRWDTRRRMEKRYAAGEAGGANREDFIQKGLQDYERSTEKKLLPVLFVLPAIVILLLSLIAK